jgi:outer membrane receptor protein involved in Fe transport
MGKRVSDYSGKFPKQAASYTTLNLRTGLESARWSLSLFAKNLTDKRGVLVYGTEGLAPSNTPGAVYGAAVITPRTIGAEAAIHF